MNTTRKRFFILTGDPGVGKTTLTKKLTASLIEKGVKATGFYTEEVRRNGVREGFDVVSLDGQRGRLARDLNLLGGPVKYKVGKYGVLVEEFEKIGLAPLRQAEDPNSLVVIDEMGKMEFFSEPFKKTIRELFSSASSPVVLASIPVRRTDQSIEGIRNHNLTKLWLVTRENRNKLHDEIMTEITSLLAVSS